MADKTTILAVDDTPESLKLLTEFLKEEGYAVRSAISGALALRYAIDNPPDLVVLDIRMPEMDGFEVCSRLKAHPSTREIPVIFVSALSETEEKVRGFALGAVDFVTKPYQRDELLARVRTHLEIERLRNHLEELVEQRTQALLESEKRLRTNLLEIASDGIHILDANGYLTQYSHSFAAMLGYADEELVGLNVEDLDELFPKDWIFEAMRTGSNSPVVFETRHRCKDGRTIDVEVCAKKIEIDGQTYVYASSRDITARKQSEEETRELLRQIGLLNQRFSLAADAAHVGVWDYLVTENHLVWDKWMYVLYGVREDEFAGEYPAWLARLHPDDLARCQEEADQSLRGERTYDTEFRVVWPTGEVRHIKSAAIVLRDADGKPLRMTGVNYDITERKNAEEQLRKLSLAVEQSPESIVITNLDAEIEYVNAAFVENTGYSFQEAIGQNPSILHSGNTPAETFSSLWDALTHGRSWGGEFHNLRKDGSEFIEFAVISPLRQSDNTITHYVAVKQDITERKRTEAELVRAKEMAESANRAKSRFLATMSHEIRTPMNGILGMAQMLLMPDLEASERVSYAETILASGKSLLLLLNDLLDFSKIEAGKLELESAALDPGRVLHDVRELFVEAAHHKGLRIESEWTGPAGQYYLGDSYRLLQMLANLVSNAVKFTAQGAIRIEGHEIERSEQRAELEFVISDSGIGIPQDKQCLLFKPFSQADGSTTRQYGGTGLGLSIVQHLAQLMGGRAGVESEVGQGARFWFRVRLGLVDDGVTALAAGEGACEAPAYGSLKGHILVVEDNPTNRKVIQAMLKKPDLYCDFVEDGQQAVDAIVGGMVPDLILMDCQMPVMDGFEATQRIRRWERENRRPRLTIIALTAGAYEEDRRRCAEAGMDDFVTKPIVIESLLAKLGSWLSSGNIETATMPPAKQVPMADDAPVFDETGLLSLFGGDRTLARSIMTSAREDMPGYFNQLAQAVASGNWKEAERKTHTLKGLAAQIGGMKLTRCLKEVNDHLKRGGKTDVATVAQLRAEYDRLLDVLRMW